MLCIHPHLTPTAALTINISVLLIFTQHFLLSWQQGMRFFRSSEELANQLANIEKGLACYVWQRC